MGFVNHLIMHLMGGSVGDDGCELQHRQTADRWTDLQLLNTSL